MIHYKDVEVFEVLFGNNKYAHAYTKYNEVLHSLTSKRKISEMWFDSNDEGYKLFTALHSHPSVYTSPSYKYDKRKKKHRVCFVFCGVEFVRWSN
jgi:proteasome lid subunit RPN8/RPN11